MRHCETGSRVEVAAICHDPADVSKQVHQLDQPAGAGSGEIEAGDVGLTHVNPVSRELATGDVQAGREAPRRADILRQVMHVHHVCQPGIVETTLSVHHNEYVRGVKALALEQSSDDLGGEPRAAMREDDGDQPHARRVLPRCRFGEAFNHVPRTPPCRVEV